VGPFGRGSGNAAILMMAGLYGGMGVGLLKQQSWARWFALGLSFIGWTFGSLLLIVLLGWLFASVGVSQSFGFLFAGGWQSAIGAFVLFFLLIGIVGVVINFKLFFHLCSEEGCQEFGVPYGSAGTVAASVGAWIGIVIVNGWMAGGGSLVGLAAAAATSNDDRANREQARLEQENEWRERQERREREMRRQEEAAIRAREQEEMIRAAQAAEAPPVESQPVEVQVEDQPVDRPEPVKSYAQRLAEERKEQEQSSRRILKCRDSSGSVTFTQGYCPPGTNQVEMPASE
jgi:hypothetical protein